MCSTVPASKRNFLSPTSDLPVSVGARTYNDSPNGTFGQYLPGIGVTQGLTPGGTGTLAQLRKTDRFRTNAGFLNLGAQPARCQLQLHRADGTAIGDQLETTVPAGGTVQINDVFGAAAIPTCAVGYAVVTFAQGDGPVWAYGSVIDNLSGDPTTIPLTIQ